MRNFKLAVILLISGFYLLSTSGLLKAQDNTTETINSDDVKSVRIKGYNICLGCLLAKEFKAVHQAEKYGHQPVLLVKKAICEKGTDLSKTEGWNLHYLLNDNSYGLFAADTLNKPVIVKGKLFISQRTIDISSYRIVDAKAVAIDKQTVDQSSDSSITTTDSIDEVDNENLSDSDKPWYYDRVKALKDSSQ